MFRFAHPGQPAPPRRMPRAPSTRTDVRSVQPRMPKLKGNILLARLTLIDELFGEEGRRKVWQKLTPEEREALDDDILTGSWYESSLLTRLMTVVESELGNDDFRLTRNLGYRSAEIQLNGVYASFIRPGDPGFLLSRCPTIWRLTHDFGQVEVRRSDKTHCVIRLLDIEAVQAHGLVGWVQRGLELSGCRQVRKRTFLRPSASDEPIFEMHWTWELEDSTTAT